MKKVFGGTAIVCLLFFLAACGATSNSATSDNSSNDNSDENNYDLTAMEEELEKFKSEPEFKSPGPAFDAKKEMEGKRILSIPVSSANPFNKSILRNMQEIADEIGFEVIEWENQGQPDEWAKGVNHAVNIDVDMIDLLGGSNPAVLIPQIKEAEKAGIEVVTSHGYEKTPEQVKYNVKVPFSQAGKLLANWACVQTNGEPNVLVITSNEADATEYLVGGIKEEFEKCPSPKVTYVNVPIPEWSSKIQTAVQSALVENPDINYVLPIYDSMSEFVISGLTLAGATDKVKIATFNGTPFVLDLVKEGKVEMVIGEDVELIARSTLDAEMRLLAGMPFPEEANIPLHIWDQSNIDLAFESSETKGSFGNEFKEKYNELWGLTK